MKLGDFKSESRRLRASWVKQWGILMPARAFTGSTRSRTR